MIEFLKNFQKNGQLAVAIDAWNHLKTVTPPVTGIADYLDKVSAALNDYGNALGAKGHFDAAVEYFEFALRASNRYAPVILNNAAGFLKDSGRLEESIAIYQQALSLNPDFEPANSGLLLDLHYKMDAPEKIAVAHKAWGDKQAARYHPAESFINSPNPDRPLKIGFISGDFGIHPVGMFFVSSLENIDRAQYLCYCYATTPRNDALTARLRKASAQWRNVDSLDNDTLFKTIQADGIDILFDLSGHTADNRLAVFARKPAPLQIAWIGYPGENGLPTMDYFIGDRFVLPNMQDVANEKKLLHLQDSFVCFAAPDISPPVTDLPAMQKGEITFGCFHNPAKCGEAVIKLWANILARLPRAKLLLKYKGFGNPSTQQRFKAQFHSFGIDPSRLEFQGESGFSEMFETISRVDLALDPFPFSGGLMTCLTLWMGVPVLTLPGRVFASRQSFSFLSTLGITETIATSAEDYCNKAVEFAQNLDRLAALRKMLRPTMKASALCDGARAAKSLEILLRNVWYHWCGNQSARLHFKTSDRLETSSR